jgi:hypothetical protein
MTSKFGENIAIIRKKKSPVVTDFIVIHLAPKWPLIFILPLNDPLIFILALNDPLFFILALNDPLIFGCRYRWLENFRISVGIQAALLNFFMDNFKQMASALCLYSTVVL